MPSITPQVRASIGGSESAPTSHRATLTAATGMNLPRLAHPETQKAGQPAITEETSAQAVTLSPQLTALARKQQKLQSEVQAQRDKESQWEKEKANYVSKDAFKAKAQQNAVEALADLGFSYDEITNLLLTQSQGDDPVRKLATEVENLKKSQEQSTNKLFEQTVGQYKAEASKLISTDPKYMMLKDEPEAAKAAVDELLEDFEKTGEPKDISYYLDLAEEGLRDVAQTYSSRFEKLKKPEPEETTAPQNKKTLPPPKAAAPRTLTQQVETTPQGRTYGQFQHLSMKERIAQAVARSQR